MPLLSGWPKLRSGWSGQLLRSSLLLCGQRPPVRRLSIPVFYRHQWLSGLDQSVHGQLRSGRRLPLLRLRLLLWWWHGRMQWRLKSRLLPDWMPLKSGLPVLRLRC